MATVVYHIKQTIHDNRMMCTI